MKIMISRYYLLLTVALAFCLTISAETITDVDSLLSIYNKSSRQERTVIGKKLLSIYASNTLFFDQTPTITNQDSRDEQDLKVWFGTVRFYTTNAYFNEALQYIERAMPLTKKHASDISATLLCDKSYCLFKTSSYEEAIETARQALKFSQQTGNLIQESRAYLYLSMVNHALRNYDEAVKLVEKAIEKNIKLGDNMQLHNALGVACEIYTSARILDKAVASGLQAVEAARKADYQPGVANHMMQLSYAYNRNGEYQKGLDMANQAIEITKSIDPIDRNLLALCMEFKSWNLIDMKRNQEAAEAMREAIRLETEIGNVHAVFNDWRTLAEALEPIDAHGAIDALRIYTKMADSIHSQQLKELMSKTNAELHNKELEEENAESHRMNRLILISSVIVVVLLAIVIASLFFAFRQKRKSNLALQRITTARESFFTNITHEFRTPLTVILGLSRELQNNDYKQKVIELGETIERQGQQLLTLVNQLLDISKVKSALGQQAWTQGDLSAYVGMVVEAHRELAAQKEVSLTYETDPEGIETAFVFDYIQKLAGNLISNAIKFTLQGGTVSVALHRHGKQMQLTVADTGKGIDAEDLPHIYEPFYRAATADSIGSGVGLALVKQIIDSLGGTITVDSQVGKGTTFKVCLYMVTPDGTESEAAPVSAVAALNVTKATFEPVTVADDVPSLLIVEDNSDVAHLIGRQLTGPYHITYANSGEQGIEKARQLIPDLIITDLMMPGTDGLQLCRTIREDEATNHIPIVVITAKVAESDRIRGLEVGADAYLNKPFNAEELNVRVEKLLEQRQVLRNKFGEISPQTGKSADQTNTDTAFAAITEEFIDKINDAIKQLMPTGKCDVEELSVAMCMSTSTLRRKMTTVTGLTPKKYIMKMQLNAAREMMAQHPEYTIAIVAEKCGFYDQSHFIKVYRNTYGVTPGARN